MYVVKEQSDRYEAVDTVADGAMGTVLLARDRLLDRMVAIKTVKLHGANDPQERQRLHDALRREAQVVQLLSHPNIVHVYDLIEQGGDGPPSVVMEYVEGTALEAFLKGGKPLPLDFALAVTSQIAEALDHAHAMGVIHGDIKPGNILITADDERVKLVDFGIARLLGLERKPDQRRFGTPRYASPEQFQGHLTDHRSDLYSLGVVLYELLTGRSPFRGSTPAEIAQEVARGAADLSDAALAEVPESLRVVLRQALEKDPAMRFQSAGELLRAVREPATPDPEDGAVATQDLSELGAPGRGDEKAAGDLGAVSGEAPPDPSNATDRLPATRGAFKVVRDPLPTQRLIWLGAGALALALALGLVLVWLLGPSDGIDGRFAQDHRERQRVLPLLKEGHRLLRAGEPDVAARIFRRAEQLLPNHPGIVQLRRRAEQEAEDLAAYRDHAQEIQELLQRARRALEIGLPRRAVTLANQVLAVEPENPEARRIADAARSDRVRSAPAAASDVSEPAPERSPAPARPFGETARPQPEAIAARSPAAPTPPGPGLGDDRARVTTDSESPPRVARPSVERPRPAAAAPSGVAELRIDVFSYLAKGVLTVYAGSDQILLEPFRFVEKQGLLRRKKTAGRIETGVRLPAGSTDFRIYVAAEGRETQTVNLTAELTGGETHVLRLIIAENGTASAQMN